MSNREQVARALREQHGEYLVSRGYRPLSTTWDTMPDERKEKWYALAAAAERTMADDRIEVICAYAQQLVVNGDEDPDTGSRDEDAEALTSWQIGTDLLSILSEEEPKEHWVSRIGKPSGDLGPLFAHIFNNAPVVRQEATRRAMKAVADGDAKGVVDYSADEVLVYLALVHEGQRAAGHEEIETWDSSQRADVVQWAVATHLAASDNDDVVVPEMPEVIRP